MKGWSISSTQLQPLNGEGMAIGAKKGHKREAMAHVSEGTGSVFVDVVAAVGILPSQKKERPFSV